MFFKFFNSTLYRYAAGYKHVSTWAITMAAYSCGVLTFASAWETRDINIISWLVLYSGLGNVVELSTT